MVGFRTVAVGPNVSRLQTYLPGVSHTDHIHGLGFMDTSHPYSQETRYTL